MDEPRLKVPTVPAVPARSDVLPRLRDAQFQPFPVHAIPGRFRSFVDAVSATLGCDPTFIILPAFAAAASAIGKSHSVRLKDGWDEPCVFWTGIVGDSGSLKTPAVKISTGPIERRQTAEYARYLEAKAHFDDNQKATKNKRGKSEEELEAPVLKRFLCGDTTIEAVADRLRSCPRGLLIVRDELSAMIGGIGEYKKAGRTADRGRWLELYDAGTLIVDRKTGDSPMIIVPRAAVSITGGIQRGILARSFDAEVFESGLAARFMLTMPPPRIARWTDAELDLAAREDFDALIDGLFLLPEERDDVGVAAIPHTLDADARHVFIEFVNEQAELQAGAEGDLAYAWGKVKGMGARLALLVHMIRFVQGDLRGPDPVSIDVESVVAGIEMARWGGAETRRIYDVLKENEAAGQVRRLVERIARRGGRITANDLRRSGRQYRDGADSAKRALEELVSQGVGRFESKPSGPRGGKPTQEFVLSPEFCLRNYETSADSCVGREAVPDDGSVVDVSDDDLVEVEL